jgi:hypothetical protein
MISGDLVVLMQLSLPFSHIVDNFGSWRRLDFRGFLWQFMTKDRMRKDVVKVADYHHGLNIFDMMFHW